MRRDQIDQILTLCWCLKYLVKLPEIKGHTDGLHFYSKKVKLSRTEQLPRQTLHALYAFINRAFPHRTWGFGHLLAVLMSPIDPIWKNAFCTRCSYTIWPHHVHTMSWLKTQHHWVSFQFLPVTFWRKQTCDVYILWSGDNYCDNPNPCLIIRANCCQGGPNSLERKVAN